MNLGDDESDEYVDIADDDEDEGYNLKRASASKLKNTKQPANDLTPVKQRQVSLVENGLVILDSDSDLDSSRGSVASTARFPTKPVTLTDRIFARPSEPTVDLSRFKFNPKSTNGSIDSESSASQQVWINPREDSAKSVTKRTKKQAKRKNKLFESESDSELNDFIVSDDNLEYEGNSGDSDGSDLAVDRLDTMLDEEEEDEVVPPKKRRKLNEPRGGRLKRSTRSKSDNIELELDLDLDEEEDLPSSRNGRRIIEDDDEEEAQLSIESEDSAEDSDEDEIAAVFEQVISACDSLSGRVRSLLEQRNIKNERDQSASSGAQYRLEKQPSLLQHSLKDYQLIGMNWLYVLSQESLNAILADEMGLGKTIQSIAFLALMKEKNTIGTHLIVVPASTLSNWERELQKWAPGLEVLKYHGPQSERSQMQCELLMDLKRSKGKGLSFDVILTTYQTVASKFDKPLFKKINFTYLVLDEAHSIKNKGSQRYQSLYKLRSERRILLTGTPLQNNLEELWTLLEFLMPKLFTKIQNSKAIFSELQRVKKRDIARAKNLETRYIDRMKKLLGPFILRRLKSQVGFQLLPKKYVTIPCEMTAEQRRLYNNLFSKTREVWLEERQKGAGAGQQTSLANFLQNIIMQLRKCASHPMLLRAFFSDQTIKELARVLNQTHPDYQTEQYEHVVEDLMEMSDFELSKLIRNYQPASKFALDPNLLYQSSGKFRALAKLLPELRKEGHRVLIFSQMTKMLDILEPFLEHLGVSFVRLDGSTPVAERQDIIDEYNEDTTITAFLLSTRAGGLGINLTAADTAIFYDLCYNPQVDRQAEDRCHRLGQEREVTIYRLITSNSCEEDILLMANEKKDLNDAMLGEGKFSTGKADIEEDGGPADVHSLLESLMSPKKSITQQIEQLTLPPGSIVDLSDE